MRELDLLGDGLPLLNRLIPWERFRPILESVPKAKPKGPGGRKPYDRIRALKCQFAYRRTRYRGLAKNGAQLTTLFALANLYMLRRHLLAV